MDFWLVFILHSCYILLKFPPNLIFFHTYCCLLVLFFCFFNELSLLFILFSSASLLDLLLKKIGCPYFGFFFAGMRKGYTYPHLRLKCGYLTCTGQWNMRICDSCHSQMCKSSCSLSLLLHMQNLLVETEGIVSAWDPEWLQWAEPPCWLL